MAEPALKEVLYDRFCGLSLCFDPEIKNYAVYVNFGYNVD